MARRWYQRSAAAGARRVSEHGPVTAPILLDGPVGTELLRRGVPTPLPLWSAHAIDTAPDVLAAIHADYAAAGATVHTANTFRCTPWALAKAGRSDAARLVRGAVEIARSAVPRDHTVAGSLAPLEDCYSPHLSPPPAEARRGLRDAAELLAAADVDLLLCETFPHPGEALLAAEAAAATGLPVWLSLTPGPFGELLDDLTILDVARRAVAVGAERVLVNCGRPGRLTSAVRLLADAGIPTGAYGNVGEPDAVQGWRSEGPSAPGPYADTVRGWVAAGAEVIGGCCGTTPAHIAALAAQL